MVVLDKMTGARLSSTNEQVVQSWRDRPTRFIPADESPPEAVEGKPKRGKKAPPSSVDGEEA